MPFLLEAAPSESSEGSAQALLRAGASILPNRFRTAINSIRDFHKKFGYWPHILFPRTFNEKALARKLFDRREKLTNWADKYAVRDYVREKLGDSVLTTVYHVTSAPSDIPLEKLPSRYVVKASHGSGWVYFVKDAANVKKEDIIGRCKYWLALNYYDLSKEWVYKDIPRRIIIEEFLDGGNGAWPIDYKFFVFGGRSNSLRWMWADLSTTGATFTTRTGTKSIVAWLVKTAMATFSSRACVKP